jgi:hypothetical protein
MGIGVLDSESIEKQNRLKASFSQIDRQSLGFDMVSFGRLSHARNSGSEIYAGKRHASRTFPIGPALVFRLHGC